MSHAQKLPGLPPAHPRSGRLAIAADLVDIPRLLTAYYAEHPDPAVAEQRVSFGTSGHRGSSLRLGFNEDHILAMSQAVCDYRAGNDITGPLFMARDTHALSEPATATALEVFAANGVTVLLDSHDGYTPTPALSHAVIAYNRGRTDAFADGIVVTPSHNPPDEGGFKYNPPSGGPAGSAVTRAIEDRANELLADGLKAVQRTSLARARAAATTASYDFVDAYVGDLVNVIDLDVIRDAGIRIGADPMGGASLAYWKEIAHRYRLNLRVINPIVDPTWRFMTLDRDGKIRMDCSSPDAMARLIAQREKFRVALANDADADRHGIVTADAGLMSPNHYLSVAIDYLFRNRPQWPNAAGVGKTVVSSSMIDRIADDLGRPLLETPVGFKWFVDDLASATIGFGGEESAGASFLRRDGTVWTTDKDGIAAALLAAEITANTGQTPSQRYAQLVERFGNPIFARVDAAATPAEKAILARLSADQITATTLAGDPITAKLTTAPSNGAPIGGIKIVTASGWLAARPSGTEDVYKIYAESFRSVEHLAEIQAEAAQIISTALRRS